MDGRLRTTSAADGADCHWAIQLYEHLIALNTDDDFEAPITREELPEEE